MKHKNSNKKNRSKFWLGISLFLLLFIILDRLFEVKVTIQPRIALFKSRPASQKAEPKSKIDQNKLAAKVIPSQGIELPIKWGDLGKKLTNSGVIDLKKFRQLFGEKLSEDQEKMLNGNWDKPVVMTSQNARFILDLLWAFGLANKNAILEEGEMTNKNYGGAQNFASTGGWTLAKGDVMNHYSKHKFVSLTPEQQELVEEVSKNIYRPCCGNSTYFPDCNHGMAMLGLLELMAAQGVSEEQMYRTALVVNSLWFPQTYLELATYFAEQGQDWQNVNPKLVLGKTYSSAQGYQTTRSKIKSLPQINKGGGGCGA